MFQDDAASLKQFAPTMSGDGANPPLQQAIFNAVKHANLLSRALGLPTTVVTIVTPAGPVVISTDSSGNTTQSGTGSSQTGSSGSEAGSPAPADPQTPAQPQAPPEAQKQTKQVCHIIGEAQFGDTLAGPSKVMCTAQTAAKENH